MNPLLLTASIIVCVVLFTIVVYCARHGYLPHLLLLCAAAGGVGVTWLGLRQLFLPRSGDWMSVAMVAIGICIVLACAVLSKKVFSSLPRDTEPVNPPDAVRG